MSEISIDEVWDRYCRLHNIRFDDPNMKSFAMTMANRDKHWIGFLSAEMGCSKRVKTRIIDQLGAEDLSYFCGLMDVEHEEALELLKRCNLNTFAKVGLMGYFTKVAPKDGCVYGDYRIEQIIKDIRPPLS